MKSLIKLTLILNIFLFTHLNGFSMEQPKTEIYANTQEKKPYIIKLEKDKKPYFLELKEEEEEELGHKYYESYIHKDENYKTADYIYKNVTQIIDDNYEIIIKASDLNESEFDYIRVQSGWHKNRNDEEYHITLSFAKRTSKGISETDKRIRIHLDENGIKHKN